jgi:RNA polymerase sigma factor (sigma-70 family)
MDRKHRKMSVIGNSLDRPSPDPGWENALDEFRRGDTATIERLERLITRSLASLDSHSLRDSWEDVSQDVLLALLRRPAACETRFVAAYVRATTLHTFLDHVRRERGRRRSDARLERSSAWRRCVPLDDVGERRSEDARGQRLVDEGVAEALTRLGERERRAVVGKYLLGQSNEEAAGALGETLSSYRRLVASGVEALRRDLLLGDGVWQLVPPT